MRTITYCKLNISDEYSYSEKERPEIFYEYSPDSNFLEHLISKIEFEVKGYRGNYQGYHGDFSIFSIEKFNEGEIEDSLEIKNTIVVTNNITYHNFCNRNNRDTIYLNSIKPFVRKIRLK